MELRCPSRILHGILHDGVMEVRCKSNRCGHRSGVIVLHCYDVVTGELLETKRFSDPTKQGDTDAARYGVSLRTS